MEVFSFETPNNHVVALMGDKRVLVDTGSPSSIGDGRSFILLGKTHRLPTSMMGLGIGELARLIGSPVDVLLGGDVLADVCFSIDWKARELRFSQVPFHFEGEAVPAPLLMSVPVVEITLSGTKLKMFLDTGAKISYLDPDLVTTYAKVGSASDFYPGVGEFETALYEVPVRIANTEIKQAFGFLPELLQMTLMLADVRGIVGNNILSSFATCFLYREEKVFMRIQDLQCGV